MNCLMNRSFGKDGDAKLLVNHQCKDSHLGGTALVQFDGTLLKLGLFIKAIPAEVNVSISQISGEFISSSRDITHDTEFKSTDEDDNLKKSSNWEVGKSIETTGDVSEFGSIISDVSWKSDTSLSEEVSNNGKHTNTSMLDLNISETVELGLITILDQTQRIEESQRLLGAKSILEGHAEGRAGACLLSRGKSSGGCDEGCEDSGLHVDVLIENYKLT